MLTAHHPQAQRGFSYALTVSEALPTGLDELTVRELRPGDTDAYWSLVRASAGHLRRHGDFAELTDAARGRPAGLPAGSDSRRVFALWAAGALVGEVSLGARAPGHWMVGYWVAPGTPGAGMPPRRSARWWPTRASA